MAQEIRYDGDVLTDVTSFSMVQNIFNGEKRSINNSQLKTLDSIVQILIFYDNIWTIKPALFGVNIETNDQMVLNTLIEKDVVKQTPEYETYTELDFNAQCEQIKKNIIGSDSFSIAESIKQYYNNHPEIAKDLEIYDKNFEVAKNPNAIEFGRQANLEKKYLPLCANMLRTNYYLNQIQQIKRKNQKMFVYSPNILRNSLVADIIKCKSECKSAKQIHSIDLLSKSIGTIEKQVCEARNSIGAKSFQANSFNLELPLMTAIIVEDCKTKEDFIDEILEWRKDNDAKKLRGWLKQFQGDICNRNMESMEKNADMLQDFLTSIEATSTSKASVVTRINRTVSEGSAIVQGNPVPLAAKVFEEIVQPAINNYMTRDLFLFMRMSKKGKYLRTIKSDFEDLFDVEIKD